MNPEGTLVAGRYQIVRQLGEGGMGVVYAADDLQLDRLVALKRVRQGMADPDARDRLRREARAAARINHPNVCQIYEIAEDRGELFIVMELVEGESLAVRLGRGPVPLDEAVPLALSVLSALDGLHQRGLVHRDLKPANVVVTPHGVKLLDFGLARAVDLSAAETGALTAAGTIWGSPAYMAPEQALNQPLDGRCDLFSVAVVLYEMLVGRPPFRGESAFEIMHAVVHEQPPALSGTGAVVLLDAVLRRGLAKRPDDRFQTAGEMAQALRMALAQVESGELPRVQAATRIIVIPFRLLRPDPEIEFLAFGLADAVALTLSSLESVVVRSSIAAARFATGAMDPKTIGAEAEVDLMLTGTLLGAGGQLRMSAQLVAAPEGTILWSQTSQVDLGDVFQLQDDLARRIVESLAIPLAAREDRTRHHDVPATGPAYELYLRANNYFYHPRDWTTARDLYLQCVREDPRYAPAWARLGRCFRLTAKFEAVARDDVQANLARADDAFRKALEINPHLPIAHNLYTALECDLGRAEDAVARLLGQARTRLSDPELFAGLVHACRYCGLLDSSVSAAERARGLDPNVATSLAHTWWMKGEYERAVDDPFGGTGFVSALALAMLGREAEAIALLAEREAPLVDVGFQAYLRALRTLLEGDRAASLAALDQVSPANPDPESVYHTARILARVGESARAIATFEHVVEAGFFCYPAFVRDPWLDPLRSDARFGRALRHAEARHTHAAARFREAGGHRLLPTV